MTWSIGGDTGHFLTSDCTTIACGVVQRPPALVILAAGLSSRFGTAKQLEPVGPSGEAILDYAIYDAARAGFSDMVLIIRPEMEEEFRQHMNQLLGGPARLAYAAQELWNVPSGLEVPAARKKPWGTAHAILAAADYVQGPFAVANADDLYGAAAYALLAAHRRVGRAPRPRDPRVRAGRIPARPDALSFGWRVAGYLLGR